MFCKNCGKELLESSKFCPECGEEVRDGDNTCQQSVGAPGDKKKIRMLINILAIIGGIIALIAVAYGLNDFMRAWELSKQIKVQEANQSGEVTNAKLTIILPDGTREGIYTGVLKAGKPDGLGAFTSEDVDGVAWTYDGEWLDGVMSGTGRCNWTDGSAYKGEYKNGLADGAGTYYKDGAVTYSGLVIQGVTVERSREYINTFSKESAKTIDFGEYLYCIPENWEETKSTPEFIEYRPNNDIGASITVQKSGYIEINKLEVREAIKESSISTLKEANNLEYGVVVDEQYEENSTNYYKLHLILYDKEKGSLDVYQSLFVRDNVCITIITMLGNTDNNYSAEAECVQSTLTKKNSG